MATSEWAVRGIGYLFSFGVDWCMAMTSSSSSSVACSIYQWLLCVWCVYIVACTGKASSVCLVMYDVLVDWLLVTCVS